MFDQETVGIFWVCWTMSMSAGFLKPPFTRHFLTTVAPPKRSHEFTCKTHGYTHDFSSAQRQHRNLSGIVGSTGQGYQTLENCKRRNPSGHGRFDRSVIRYWKRAKEGIRQHSRFDRPRSPGKRLPDQAA